MLIFRPFNFLREFIDFENSMSMVAKNRKQKLSVLVMLLKAALRHYNVVKKRTNWKIKKKKIKKSFWDRELLTHSYQTLLFLL